MDRIRKGDTVVVIAGEDKGKRGKVLRVLHEDGPRGRREGGDGQAPHQARRRRTRRAASSRRRARSTSRT